MGLGLGLGIGIAWVGLKGLGARKAGTFNKLIPLQRRKRKQ